MSVEQFVLVRHPADHTRHTPRPCLRWFGPASKCLRMRAAMCTQQTPHQIFPVLETPVTAGVFVPAARATARMVRDFSPPRFHNEWAALRIRSSRSGSGCRGIFRSSWAQLKPLRYSVDDVYITLLYLKIQALPPCLTRCLSGKRPRPGSNAPAAASVLSPFRVPRSPFVIKLR